MSRYDKDSAAEKEMWRKLHELADAAVMVYHEEQRAKKGKSKIVSEEEEEDDKRIRLFDHVPRKIRSWVRYPQQNYENLNGASTSSSLLHLLCFEPLNYNTAESKKTETKTPPNPNSQSSCLTESASRKRRAVEMPQRKISSGKFKKAKVAPFPRPARETPEWLVQVMRDMTGSQDPRLIFERSLSASDVNSGQSRLLIPFNMLTRNDFLTHAESRAIEREDIEEENIGVGMILVNRWSEKWGLRFKRWAMEKKKSGNGTLNYALNWGWNDVVKGNGLVAEDEISLWTFRCRGVLCFALEHRPKGSI